MESQLMRKSFLIVGLLLSIVYWPAAAGQETNELFLRRDSRKSVVACPERELLIESECPTNCSRDGDCPLGESCLCFGECGMSCINKQKATCKHPGTIEKGKVVYVGPTGLYELKFPSEKVPSGGHVLFECDVGFSLVEGPPGKVCEDGEWEPKESPFCVSSEAPTFPWIRTGRLKRRAIKTGGSSSIVRSKTGPGGGSGALGTRRTKKKGNRFGDDDDLEMTPIICPNLDHDPFIQTEVIQSGSEQNETFSAGAVVKVSCKPGFGVNLPNETVSCDKGRWKPKIPQCSALPCKTPYIMHGTFYEGTKPLYFQEFKKHKTIAEVRCAKGYKLKGPSKLHCWFGEWDIDDSPECHPAPCKLPVVDNGSYLSNYDPGQYVQHGTEVDYVCGGSFRKLISGPFACKFGGWKPHSPFCFQSSITTTDVRDFLDGKKRVKDVGLPPILSKKACGPPQRQKGAFTYVAGLPVEWDKQFNFQDGTDVVYRCSTLKAKSRNRWQTKCDNGTWTKTNLTCDGTAPIDEWMTLPIMSMINGSCTYKRTDKHVVTFYDEQIILEDSKEFEHGTLLTSRCVDIGKFKLEGAVRRRCLSGQWMGITPKCEGLSQYQDYALDKPPTILLRYQNGSIVQSMDGKLVIVPGTTLHMECLWIRKFGKPTWSTSIANKTFAEGWADDPSRDAQLEYRLTIEAATTEDSGTYSCKTPARHTHEIVVIVKNGSCPPLPYHQDLIYSSNETILGARVVFGCRLNNTLVGASEVFCSAAGKWSAPLPSCQNIQCRDISLLPAYAPLATTSLTRNGTLKRNGTAPPKVIVYGTYVGARASFNCEQGFMVEGAREAICMPSGEWSNLMPLCKEVECGTPPVPENAVLVGTVLERYSAGVFANFECKTGFMMEGQPMVACQDSGVWSKVNLKCKTGCNYPGSMIYGTLQEIKFYYDVGEVVTFECNEGYELQGATQMSCGRNGKWSSLLPTCVPMQNFDHVSNRQ